MIFFKEIKNRCIRRRKEKFILSKENGRLKKLKRD